MPTYGRHEYVCESLSLFLAQDYPHKELIIVNDCPGQLMETEAPGVRVFNFPSRFKSLGLKRNFAIQQAAGEIIAVWDDDDIYLPWHLSLATEVIVNEGREFFCPQESWSYWGTHRLREMRSSFEWINHATWVFRKNLWNELQGYPEITLGEDLGLLNRYKQRQGLNSSDELEYAATPRRDRSLITRITSQYAHTSWPHGGSPPDTSPGKRPIIPMPIGDRKLSSAVDRLCHERSASIRVRERFRQGLPTVGCGTPECCVYLDSLRPVTTQVGFGNVGMNGSLGYEGKQVEIQGTQPLHSISAHGPSSLVYSLDRQFKRLTTLIAFNDDVAGSEVAASFSIVVDGNRVAKEIPFVAGCLPQRLEVDVSGVETLELKVSGVSFERCHTVWIDPVLSRRDSEQCRVKCPDRGGEVPLASGRDVIAVGMITCPRPGIRLSESIERLVRGGFGQKVNVFCEPGEVEDNLGPAVSIHRNDSRLGVLGNWIHCLTWLYENTDAEFLLVCEDDVDLARGAHHALTLGMRQYDQCGFFSLFTPFRNASILGSRHGWVPCTSEADIWGSLALCFPRSSARMLLEYVPLYAEDPLRGATDLIVAQCFVDAQLPRLYHSPSLANHLGRISTVGHKWVDDNIGLAFDREYVVEFPDLYVQRAV